MKKKKQKKNDSIIKATNSLQSNPLYISVLVLWGAYLYFTLNAPNTSGNPLHISKQVLDLLRISIALPYLLIWLSATYSYIKIKRYSVTIAPSKEASAFNKIANGVGLLLGSLILSNLFSTIRSYLGDFSDLRPLLTILTNYAYVLPFLIAFIYLFNAVIELSKNHEDYKIPVIKSIVFGMPFVAFAYTWLELIFTNQFRITPEATTHAATYYLKDSLLILTLVFPALISWAIGFLAVAKLKIYNSNVNGIIYKRALKSLVNGFACVIFSSILLQALLSLGTPRLIDMGLARLLGVIYIFLVIQALGFIFIAKGANNLTKIETV